MATTVIDQLIVKLGLDPRDFTKGEKEVAASVLRTKKTVEGAAREMDQSVGASLLSFAKRAAVIAVVLKGVKMLASGVLDASRAVRQLGNDARGYDIAANKLRNFQNVAEIMGGSAEDATKTIAGLQRAIFNLTFNGQMSDQLVMLGRLGVQFQDAAGHARDFTAVYLDTAAAIEQAQAAGTMTKGEAFQYLQAAGFDPSLAQAALGGRGAAQAALSQQEARRQVSGADVASATRIEQAITSAGQAKTTAFERGIQTGEGTIVGIAHGAEAVTDGSALTTMGNAISSATTALRSWTAALMGRARGALPNASKRAPYERTIQSAARQYGLDPELLAGVLNTESGFNPNALSSAGAVGIAQFTPKTAKGRGFTAGVDAHRDINEAAKYLKELHDSFARSGNDENAAWNLATMSYNAGESRIRGGKPLAAETQAYPGKVLAYAGMAAPTPGAQGGNVSMTKVDVGEVNVYTASKDADGMADAAGGALRRKLMASQAEQGMQ